jgi:hypothetical protein
MASTEQIIIYRGDTMGGTIQLRKVDPCSGVENLYPISLTDTIQVNFPGDLATVVLSTANAGEINIADQNLSTIIFTGAPAKSLLLKLASAKTPASLNVIHTDGAGKVTTFQQDKVLVILDRANP